MATKYHFTTEMLGELKELYPNTLSADLAKRFNCSVSAIYDRAQKLGVKKSKEFRAETSRKHMQDPNHPGRNHQFKKGQIPPNKGKKQSEYMSAEAIVRASVSRFEEGHTPSNTKPIGHERVTKDGYVEVKTKDVGCLNNFELKHRVVWKEHNGSIPKGYNIQFKDGNRQNCNIENLYIISRAAQVATENSIHRYPDELKKAIKLTKKLNKSIKQHEQAN